MTSFGIYEYLLELKANHLPGSVFKLMQILQREHLNGGSDGYIPFTHEGHRLTYPRAC